MSGATETSLPAKPPSPAARLRHWGAAAATCGIGALAVIRCGGTTGREGLDGSDASASAALDGASGVSDDASLDPGSFDVTIPYVDRVLPDVSTPADAGAGVGDPWPSCPPFIPIGPDGGPVPPGSELNQIPAAYGDAGAEVPAADGSPCATYGWLGSTAADACLTSSSSGWGQDDFPLLPPCSWCSDAGTASQGPGAGVSAYRLCLNLYTCAMRSGCGAGQDPATCLCGHASASECIVDAGGPCATEEMAALQYRSDSVEQALSNYTQIDPAFLGYCGSALNYVLQNARSGGCFPPADAGGK